MVVYDPQRAQLVSVAKMYYLENLTQNDIALKMGISRPQVSKLLALAREQGIVTITVNDQVMEVDNARLLELLCEKYKLKGGLVISDEENVSDCLKQTGLYLALESQQAYTIGLGWGSPLGGIIDQLRNNSFKAASGVVCPLIGNAPITTRDFNVNEMTDTLAGVLGRKCMHIHDPAFAESREEKMLREQMADYQEISSKWKNLDMAILSVKNYPSSPDEATGMRFGVNLTRQHAVGSFLSYFYNQHGDIISGENDFTCRATLADLRHCTNVFGICIGAGHHSIVGALQTGIFTHVILTAKAAQEIL